jgi:catechol 2,3-dioxygenase-like lactoylglutathione lyase family enzyme
LGLRSATTSPAGTFRWITVGAPPSPAVSIVLTNYLNGSPADVEALEALLAKGALNGVHFQTDDLDGSFSQISGTGAEIVQEPTTQPWGTRDFALRDPSGNMIRIDQPPA